MLFRCNRQLGVISRWRLALVAAPASIASGWRDLIARLLPVAAGCEAERSNTSLVLFRSAAALQSLRGYPRVPFPAIAVSLTTCARMDLRVCANHVGPESLCVVSDALRLPVRPCPGSPGIQLSSRRVPALCLL